MTGFGVASPTETNDRKWIYGFAAGQAEGRAEQNELLGGKGAGLAEMSRLGIPVPPGFTLTTEVCRHYLASGGKLPDNLEQELREQLRRLEDHMGQGFGDPERPLLVSVRSGASISMPGMMDTVLNLGLTRAIVEAASAEAAWFRRDCYRRLLTMYADVVLAIPARECEQALTTVLADEGRTDVQQLSVSGLDGVIDQLEDLIGRRAQPFPQDPLAQLWGAIGAVFESWNNQRAKDYRRIHGIAGDLGTGVTVQAMVFGNRGQDCATGVAFSRNPATGEPELYGEFLVNAQGEDVVAGTHTPRSIQPTKSALEEGAEGREESGGLAALFPDAHQELLAICSRLERHFRNMQDLEFTIERGRLFMLQTRAGKRSGPAAIRIAADMVEERLIDRREALRRVEPQHVVQIMAPVFDLAERERALNQGRRVAGGLAAGPGAASGRIALDAERATEMAKNGPVLLVRDETSPEDIVGMHAAAGILTTRGGMTSHAAVVARGLGKPCVVGAAGITVHYPKRALAVAGRELQEGDWLSIDGTRGDVLAGELATVPAEVVDALVGESSADAHGNTASAGKVRHSRAVESFLAIMAWADRERRLGVRANADTPEDATIARTFGAQGIGLCRTEHMFFDQQRIPLVRQMILARETVERKHALDQLLPLQESDFAEIFRRLAGLPVTIRLLDPPLHEFLPHDERALAELARRMGLTPEEVADKASALSEVNPMLGHRGCRLGVTYPEIYQMQCRAIARAACQVLDQGIAVRPEVMVPLTGTAEEMVRMRALVVETIREVETEHDLEIGALIGTMIEVPRAALQASAIALSSDFFSFGTNDLTQMTFGFSRDDAGRFLPNYLEDGILPFDPFERIDAEGVGELVATAARRGRAARPELKLGVCGEHGGEPFSIEFFDRCGLDYVSCSPYRVPVARLAAARARLAFDPVGGSEGLEPKIDDPGGAASQAHH